MIPSLAAAANFYSIFLRSSPSNQYQDTAGQTGCKTCSTGTSFASAFTSNFSMLVPQFHFLNISYLLGVRPLRRLSLPTFNACSPFLTSHHLLGYYRKSASSQATCVAGSACGGNCAIAACGPGTYQDQTGQTACKAWCEHNASRQDLVYGTSTTPARKPSLDS